MITDAHTIDQQFRFRVASTSDQHWSTTSNKASPDKSCHSNTFIASSIHSCESLVFAAEDSATSEPGSQIPSAPADHFVRSYLVSASATKCITYITIASDGDVTDLGVFSAFAACQRMSSRTWRIEIFAHKSVLATTAGFVSNSRKSHQFVSSRTQHSIDDVGQTFAVTSS